MACSGSRVARLKLDLSELLASPYPGVSIVLDDSNVHNFCLHLCPDSGPWKGLRLHFDVELPDEWPTRPPKVRSTASIDHPNVYGSFICCDLLRISEETSGGYTPAFTLQGLFMQFLTFFSSEKVEQEYGGWIALGEDWVNARSQMGDKSITVSERSWRWTSTCQSCSEIRCTKCGYGTLVSHIPVLDPTSISDAKLGALKIIEPSGAVQSLASYDISPTLVDTKRQSRTAVRAPAVIPPYMTPPKKSLLPMLNDDTLYTILTAMPSETLLSFCAAYQRAHTLMNQFHILTLRELRCFFLRQPLADCILGIGVHFDRGTFTLSSDFDWLSLYAFDAFSVRLSIRKHPFEFFLPLAFSRAHFSRAKESIWNRLLILDTGIEVASRKRRSKGRAPRTSRHQAVRVIYQLMNDIVVSLVQSTSAVIGRERGGTTLLLLSERAVVAYCQLYHLLTSLAASDPEILRDATVHVRRFLSSPAHRTKQFTPNMGEFIVMASLVLGSAPIDGGEPITWTSHLNGPLLEEIFVRNVMWSLRDHPELQVLEDGFSQYRLAVTLQSAKTALRLTMFQVAFLSTVVAPHLANPTRLSDSYGFPVKQNLTEKPVDQKMVETIKGIYGVSSWPEFFDLVGFVGGKCWGKEKFCQVLRDCVKKSLAAGYHPRVSDVKMAALQTDRKRVENAWLKGERYRRYGATRPLI